MKLFNRTQWRPIEFDRGGMVEILRSIANDLENGGGFSKGVMRFGSPPSGGLECEITIHVYPEDKP